MKTFAANAGLKTKALISMKWEKKGDATILYVMDVNMIIGYIKKSKNRKYSAHLVISGENKKIGDNLKAVMAMQSIHDHLGLK